MPAPAVRLASSLSRLAVPLLPEPRVGGRPKGLSPQAEATALAAETLYRERKLSVAAIAQKLHLSKSTLYSYLQHRGVGIGT